MYSTTKVSKRNVRPSWVRVATTNSSQENLKPKEVKSVLQEWEEGSPGCKGRIFGWIFNVLPEHLLDHNLFDFAVLGKKEEQLTDGGPHPSALPAHESLESASG